jgi:predicted nucleotide-binding protein (sugar kinase/HSP70/actin superfamily)
MSTTQEILEIIRQRFELQDQRRRKTDRREWAQLTLRAQVLDRKLTSCHDEFVGRRVEAVLDEINAIYDLKVEGHAERAAADVRLKLLWDVAKRRRAASASTLRSVRELER